MTKAVIYRIYGCPSCHWRLWISDLPVDPLANVGLQARHDELSPYCPGGLPIMLIDRARGGVRT
jgi:hypothetical protein